MKIDFHCHFFPEELVVHRAKELPGYSLSTGADGKRYVTYPSGTFPLPTAQERLAEMDALGIDIGILTTPGANDFLGAQDLSLFCRCNDFLAGLARDHPTRFKSFAVMPLDSLDAALKELARALDELGMDGVALGSNIKGQPLDSPEFLPFFKEANRRGLPIFIHPAEPAGAQVMRQHSLIPLVAYPFETTLAATRLVLSGIFEKFQNINLVLPHLGGALPYLMERIDFTYWERGGAYPGLAGPPSQYFKRFYYDTAIGYHMPALRCAYDSVGADHLVFGTDIPFGREAGFARRALEAIEALGLNQEEKEMIYSGNASRILPTLQDI